MTRYEGFAPTLIPVRRAGWWRIANALVEPCPHGEWEVENRGIAPDVPVEELPKDFAAGHDRQLETGVQQVPDELKANPIPPIPIPPFPNYHKSDGLEKQ